MICDGCGHEQAQGRFCGRCGAVCPPDAEQTEARDATAGSRVAGTQAAAAADVGGSGDAADVGDVEVEGAGESARPSRMWPLVAALGAVAVVMVLQVSAQNDGTPRLSPQQLAAIQDVAGVEPLPTAALPATVNCSSIDGSQIGAEGCAVWAVRSDDAELTHLAVSGQRVIAATERAVFAVDRTTGDLAWSWPGSASAVQATAGHVLVATDDHVAVLDPVTGASRWELPRQDDELTTWQVHWNAVVERGPSVLGVRSVLDGELVWQREVAAVGDGSAPVVAGDRVIDLADGKVGAYLLSTGEELWQADIVPTQPLLYWPDAEHVVAVTAQGLVGLELTSGEVAWERTEANVRELGNLDADRLAVVHPGRRTDIVDRETGEVTTELPFRSVSEMRPAGEGAYFTRAGATIRRWDVDQSVGPGWQLQAVLASSPEYLALSHGVDEQVVAVLGDGRTLAAFHVERSDDDGETSPAGATDPFGCDGAEVGDGLGDLPTWRGDRTHVAVTGEEPERELWLGIPGAGSNTTFTVRAGHLDGDAPASFAHFGGPWDEELTVDGGGRAASGFVTHWVAYATFAREGCWLVQVTGEDIEDEVVVPVAATGSTG